jgi:hypothetical protein
MRRLVSIESGLFGTGTAVKNAAAAVATLGVQRGLLIADAFAMELANAIAARTPVVERIHDIVQHVPLESARAAVALAKEKRVDAVITIGGGSATGLAEPDIPEAARIILPSIPPSNPRPVAQADLESLLYDAWAGVPVTLER